MNLIRLIVCVGGTKRLSKTVKYILIYVYAFIFDVLINIMPCTRGTGRKHIHQVYYTLNISVGINGSTLIFFLLIFVFFP